MLNLIRSLKLRQSFAVITNKCNLRPGEELTTDIKYARQPVEETAWPRARRKRKIHTPPAMGEFAFSRGRYHIWEQVSRLSRFVFFFVLRSVRECKFYLEPRERESEFRTEDT